jgi:hypothetical protein
MPDESYSAYLLERAVEANPSPTLDHVPLVKPDGTVKRVKVSSLTGRVVGGGGDPIPIDTDTIDLDNFASDVDAPIDGNYGTTDSTDNITAVILAAGKKFTLEFTANGGDIIGDGSTLIVQGKQITGRGAGDKAEFVGLPGDAVELVQYIRKSGAPAKPFYFEVDVIAAEGNIDIATDLNDGDILNGLPLIDGQIAIVPNQSDLTENGIWVVDAVPYRHPLFDTFDSMQGVLFRVANAGTSDPNTTWVCTSAPGGTIDTNDINFRLLTGTNAGYHNGSEEVELGSGGLNIHPIGNAYYRRIRVNSAQTDLRALLFNLPDAGVELTFSGDFSDKRPVVGKAADFTATGSEHTTIYQVDTSGGNVTATVDLAANCVAGKTHWTFWVKDATNKLYVKTSSSSDQILTSINSSPLLADDSSALQASMLGSVLTVTYLGTHQFMADGNGDWTQA